MKIESAWTDDWIALYIDGELWQQTHRFSFLETLKELIEAHPDVKLGDIEIVESEVNDVWAMYYGHFPDRIEDVVWANQEWTKPSNQRLKRKKGSIAASASMIDAADAEEIKSVEQLASETNLSVKVAKSTAVRLERRGFFAKKDDGYVLIG